MKNEHTFEDFKSFILFLYIYMASADGHIDDREVDVILEKLKKIYPEKSIHNDIFERALKEFTAIDPEALDGIIEDSFKKFRDESFTKKFKIFADLYDIINADGVVDESESQSIEKLKHMIEQNI
jgi:uncharacterized tellurite resistance protein B-like protein